MILVIPLLLFMKTTPPAAFELGLGELDVAVVVPRMPDALAVLDPASVYGQLKRAAAVKLFLRQLEWTDSLPGRHVYTLHLAPGLDGGEVFKRLSTLMAPSLDWVAITSAAVMGEDWRSSIPPRQRSSVVDMTRDGIIGSEKNHICFSLVSLQPTRKNFSRKAI